MTEFLRQATHYYDDPLSRVWIACAEAVGFRIVRTEDAYASTDGCGTILIAVDNLFDPDDSVAQMILHELCHALVEGEDAEKKVDWGIGHAGGNNPWREHASLRLQAYLAGRVGLRDFFAPTTDFRVSFWDALPADPFYASSEAGGRRERSCVAARLAAWRASQPRWSGHLDKALTSSAAIAAATPRLITPGTARISKADSENDFSGSPFCKKGVGGDSFPVTAIVPAFNPPSPPFAKGDEYFPKLPNHSGIAVVQGLPCPNSTQTHGKPRTPKEEKSLPSLWSTVGEPPEAHPSGHAPVAGHFQGLGCSDCAWSFAERRTPRCRHVPSVHLPDKSPACWRFEPVNELDCQTCGACCREAYHAVEISSREPVNKRHPELVVIQDTRRKLLRNGERCAALIGGKTPNEAYSCAIYEDRPRTCREFTRGSENCLDARRRVGLSL